MQPYRTDPASGMWIFDSLTPEQRIDRLEQEVRELREQLARLLKRLEPDSQE